MGDEIKYVDFEVAIKKDGDEYLVQAKSGKSKAQTRFDNPFDDDQRKLIRSTVTKAVRSANAQRIGEVLNAPLPELRDMKSFGSLLYSEAINGPVSDFYKKCAKQSDRIRLRLTVDQSLDDLPWEFLCTNDDFIALNPDTPVVRYIEGTEPCSLVNVEYPLRVLVVIAKPSDLIPLQSDDEKNSILAALKPVIDQGLVKLDVVDGNDTWEKLITELRPNRTHILHFIGHGTFDEKGEGVVLMTDSEGKSMPVDSERFRYLMKSRSRLALVVLNSCLGTKSGDGEKFSSVAAGLVKSGVPAVIAMQYEISDDSARVIAKTFYTSLALNMPVDAALTEARLQIFLDDKNNLEWATPVLYMQIPDGQLFEFRGPRPKSLSANLDDVIGSEVNRATPEKALEANARWKDRLYQFGNWFTSTPEVEFKPEPGVKPDSPATQTDVFEKGRQVWNDWFGPKKTSAPMSPNVKPRTLPAAQPPAPTQTRPPVIPTAQPAAPTQTPPPVRPANTPTRSETSARLQTPTSTPPKPPPQAPPLQRPVAQPPSATTGMSSVSPSESRIYQTPLVPAFLADTIRQYFISQGCDSQVLEKGTVWVSQGRKTQVDVRASAGLAATIVIERSGPNLRVSIGGGRWLDPGTFMALRGDPVAALITGPIAMDPHRTLISFLWDIVDTRVTRSNGSRIA